MGFVVLVCLGFIGTAIWSNWKAHDIQLREATTVTRNMTGFLAQHADDTFRAADTVLLGLVERVERDGMAPAALPRLHHWLQQSVAQLKMLNGIFAYDQDGTWIVTSQDSIPNNVNNADREYFQYHKTHSDRGSHIGAPVKSRSTQQWIIPVSRRINHDDGSFAGVVLTTIEVDYFLKFYDSFDIGEAGAIFLASKEGAILARRPFESRMLNQDISKGTVFTQLRTQGPGTTMLTSKVDGVERLYSYRRVTDYPLVVATALSRIDILQDWRQDAYRSVLETAFLIVILASIGWRLTSQIGLRERTEDALRVAKLELENLNRSLEILSLQDSLTGLGNRRHFDQELARAYRRGLRNQTSLALIMIDVDYFKRYNDVYGHPVGDECLRKLAHALDEALCRPNDVAARYGGEELAVLLSETDAAGARVVAERIRSSIQALSIPHTGNPAGHVTVSLGVAMCLPEQPEGGASRLVDAADRALYAAKNGGRNRVCFDEVL
ncbi:sensor domain-containing diguanylate cyclase [Actimicrobium antarcticum]|uniref:diguanylate cyclase n=2 Tax=Actimicrobium antarcticum TaxID=1051899 RepID=A0ABP7T8E9_9BURK